MMEAENSNFHELIIGEKKRRLKAKIVMMPCADLTLTNSPQHEILDASKKSEDENPNSLFLLLVDPSNPARHGQWVSSVGTIGS